MSARNISLSVLLLVILASCTAPSSTQTPTSPANDATNPVSTSTILPPTVLTPTPAGEARLERGDLAYFNGDYALAQTEYGAALANSFDPNINAAALWGLARTDIQVDNTASALTNLNELITSYPDSPYRHQAHYLRAGILMELGRYVESTEAYTTFLLAEPGLLDFYAYQNRGDAYASLENYPDAIKDYQLALNSPHLSAYDTPLLIKLAQAYQSSGDAITALGMYDEIATNSANDSVKAQMDLFAGRLHLSIDQPTEAYGHFLHTVQNYPLAYESYSALVALVEAGVPVSELDRGLVDYFAGQNGYALDAFTRYIAATPENDGTVFYYRAQALRASGLYQESLAAFTYFIANYPANRYWSAAWDEQADILWYELDEYSAAAQTLIDYTHVTSDLPSIPLALLNAGRIYERAGWLAEAAATWEAIASSHPGSDLVPQSLFNAGIAYYRLADFPQALLAFQRAVLFTQDPDEQSKFIFWIGKTQQQLGDEISAQDSFRQAASIDQTGYYSIRAADLLAGRPHFVPPPAYDFEVDWAAERLTADAWLRVTFALSPTTDLSGPGELSSDGRFVRGTALWQLGFIEEARLEFEDLRTEVEPNPESSYRLGNYLLAIGLYRPAIFALRQVLTLAGLDEQAETFAAPPYFNYIRYGTYYQDLVLSSATDTGLHPLVLFSVIRQESLYEGFVHSQAGARGLMQVMPFTGEYVAENLGWPPDFTPEDLYRPLVSIRLGSYYLQFLQGVFNGSLVPALAAYDAGPGNADIWYSLANADSDLFLEIVRYAEPRDYIRRIYEIFSVYSQLYGTIP